VLKIENLCKSYGTYHALHNLNLEIDKGRVMGLVGPNGAGKTTTMKILAGLLLADSGKIVINGEDISENIDRVKDFIGYMPDFFGVYDNLKVSEYMEFFMNIYGIEGLTAKQKYMELLDMVGLLDKENSYVDGLSRGMKQRLCLARTLVHNPKLLILDEPASGLDPRTRYEFKEILKRLRDLEKTILISSHVLAELAEVCTNIAILDRGKTVLQESMENLEEKLNSVKPLIITVLSETDKVIKILRNNELIKTITIVGNTIYAEFIGGKYEEAALLKSIIIEGVNVCEFRREQGNLEALFIELTEKNPKKVVISYD
jgi:ABC-type multidrug transport system, ATPase component